MALLIERGNRMNINLRYSKNPDPDKILKILETTKLEPVMRKAWQAKYDAMTTPLTTLEKTMSTEQLKEMGHPAWARELTAEHLRLHFIYGTDDYHLNGQRKDERYDTRNV